MDAKIISAIIAGVVSITASIVTIFLAKKKIQSENENLSRSLSHQFTSRLYDQRLPAYQHAISIASKLSKRQAPSFPYTQNHTDNIYKMLLKWKSTEGSLILSSNSNTLFHELLDLLQKHASVNLDEDLSNKIWGAKNTLVSSLRSDLDIVSEEEE